MTNEEILIRLKNPLIFSETIDNLMSSKDSDDNFNVLLWNMYGYRQNNIYLDKLRQK